ncbi:MAG: L-threonylcarbamoyladenylate synthase [bacterium]|nr:L-threonylcarbamoyladenylate synthase [bacterium]
MSDSRGKMRRSSIIIYPTETAYAIGCDATNARAVAAIFRLKGRERGKSLPLIVASRAMAERYAQFTPLARQLSKRYWPGPLTLVLAQRFSPPPDRRGSERGWKPLAPGVIAADGTVALRVSSHPIARRLSRQLGHPIISTSANRSGEPPAFSARAAMRAFLADRNVLLMDVGALPRRKPSTIVDARGSEPIILRQGAVSLRGAAATKQSRPIRERIIYMTGIASFRSQ